jgi:hypothetical protein
VEQQIAQENKLLKEQESLRELVFNLGRMTQIKIDEKEQKAKDFLKAQVTNCLVWPPTNYDMGSRDPHFNASLIRK